MSELRKIEIAIRLMQASILIGIPEKLLVQKTQDKNKVSNYKNNCKHRVFPMQSTLCLRNLD